jgi:hypothetical protein
LEVFLLRNGEVPCFCDVLPGKDKFSILEDHIDQLPVIVDANIHQSGEIS